MNNLQAEYLKKLALRDARIRLHVLKLGKSKAQTGRLFGISRERVRQIVEQAKVIVKP